MKCPVCHQKMTSRTGRFGEFYVCKPHGTLSISNNKLVCTGEIFKTIKNKVNSQVTAVAISRYHCEKPIDFELVVRTQMAAMGFWADDLDLFIEGGPGIADIEPDHWMNLRPY